MVEPHLSPEAIDVGENEENPLGERIAWLGGILRKEGSPRMEEVRGPRCAALNVVEEGC